MAGEPDRARAGLPDLPLSTLRSYRNALRREESRVSYWRRLVHARLDLAMAGGAGGELTRFQVAAALGDGVVWHRRLAVMSVEVGDPLPALPDLGVLCSRPLPGPDDEATALLAQAERQLSAYRTAVHRLLDEATAELVARYRADPRACLSVLPSPRTPADAAPELHR